jgi:competence protein ComEC
MVGDLEIRCLGPASNLIGKDRNDYSMVLSLTYRNFSMLFTGDIEEAGERALIVNEDLSHHTILKVAHHGSRTSSSQSFLEQVNPKIALISAGQNNRFNHPSSEVVKRLESFGAEIYVTNEVGAITVKTDGNTVRIEPYIW